MGKLENLLGEVERCKDINPLGKKVFTNLIHEIGKRDIDTIMCLDLDSEENLPLLVSSDGSILSVVNSIGKIPQGNDPQIMVMFGEKTGRKAPKGVGVIGVGDKTYSIYKDIEDASEFDSVLIDVLGGFVDLEDGNKGLLIQHPELAS